MSLEDNEMSMRDSDDQESAPRQECIMDDIGHVMRDGLGSHEEITSIALFVFPPPCLKTIDDLFAGDNTRMAKENPWEKKTKPISSAESILSTRRQ